MLSSQSSRPLSSSPSFPSPCAPSVSAFSPLPSFRSAGIQTRIFLSSSALMTSLPTSSFTIRIYEKLASNPCRIRTSKTQHLKSFRIRIYGKRGGGGRQIVLERIDRRSGLVGTALPFRRRRQLTSNYSLPTTHYPLFTIHYSLLNSNLSRNRAQERIMTRRGHEK